MIKLLVLIILFHKCSYMLCYFDENVPWQLVKMCILVIVFFTTYKAPFGGIYCIEYFACLYHRTIVSISLYCHTLNLKSFYVCFVFFFCFCFCFLIRNMYNDLYKKVDHVKVVYWFLSLILLCFVWATSFYIFWWDNLLFNGIFLCHSKSIQKCFV